MFLFIIPLCCCDVARTSNVIKITKAGNRSQLVALSEHQKGLTGAGIFLYRRKSLRIRRRYCKIISFWTKTCPLQGARRHLVFLDQAKASRASTTTRCACFHHSERDHANIGVGKFFSRGGLKVDFFRRGQQW